MFNIFMLFVLVGCHWKIKFPFICFYHYDLRLPQYSLWFMIHSAAVLCSKALLQQTFLAEAGICRSRNTLLNSSSLWPVQHHHTCYYTHTPLVWPDTSKKQTNKSDFSIIEQLNDTIQSSCHTLLQYVARWLVRWWWKGGGRFWGGTQERSTEMEKAH